MKQTLITLGLVLSLIGGLLLRLKDLNAPLADWHSFRQADTASVAREYVKNGIDLLHPRYHDVSNIASGKENPEGYRMVEFPLINGFVAFLYRSIPWIQSMEIHVFYRLVNIVLSLVSAIVIYHLIKYHESAFTGLLAAIVFLALPYNVYYSRTILPEIGLVTATLIALYYGSRYLNETKLLFGVTAALAAAVALLLKPMAGFFLAALLPYAIHKQGIKSLGNWKHLLLAGISVIPLILWRQWIAQFPEGIPSSDWLFNGNGIRFKGAFFYWIFADRLGRLILGYWGLILLGLGAIATKKTSFVFWWLIGTLAYVTVIATGNVQHDYYQIPTIPIIAVLIAYGIQLLRRLPVGVIPRHLLIFISVSFMLAFSWYHIKGYYGINNPAIIQAGKAVAAKTPSDALVIAPYMGDTAFLYQTNRRGWPIGFSIDQRLEQGASYYVSTSYDDEARELENKFTLVEKTDQYILIHLTPRPTQ